MRSRPSECASALLLTMLCVGGAACPRNTEPAKVTDAAVATLRDARVRGHGRRRRARGSGMMAAHAVARTGSPSGPGTSASAMGPESATGPTIDEHTIADPGSATQDDLALGAGAGNDEDNGNDDESATEAPRPRITETGPMLPESLGSAPTVSYDMASDDNGGGAMGLEPSQVSRGLNPLLGRLTACAEATSDGHGGGPHGRVSVRLRIHNDGRPVAARISGGGGPPAFITCARRVVASARFDHFRGPDAFASWGFDVQ